MSWESSLRLSWSSLCTHRLRTLHKWKTVNYGAQDAEPEPGFTECFMGMP